jgi:hypothetical protein
VRGGKRGISGLFALANRGEQGDFLKDLLETRRLGKIPHGFDNQLFVRHAQNL